MLIACFHNSQIKPSLFQLSDTCLCFTAANLPLRTLNVSVCTNLNLVFSLSQAKLLIFLTLLCEWLELPLINLSHRVRNLEMVNNYTQCLIMNCICMIEILSVSHKIECLSPQLLCQLYHQYQIYLGLPSASF